MTSSNSAEAEELVASLSASEVEQLMFDWLIWAHPQQLPPDGDWTTWLLIGGRGAGKTRAGAEWVRSLAGQGVTPIALVGETLSEVMAVMIKGDSGLLHIQPPDERPVLRGNSLIWANGVEAIAMSASDPDRFRGPQFAAAWCDEVAKWPHAEAAWDMLQFGLRLGDKPRQLATTTPKPTKLLKRLLADKLTAITRMKTADNQANLANSFLDAIVGRYRGSVLGRQELDGEMIEDLPDALWQRAMFKGTKNPVCSRIVVAVDPPVTGHARSDACGIVIAGLCGEGAVVLEDRSVKPAAPLVWARRAVAAFHAHKADAIVVEVNQGGDLVKSVIAQIDPDVPVKAVRAMRGKWLRAEPVAALYGRGLIAHVAGLHELEDEMCGFGADGRSQGHSPDRVDALVWALSELLLHATKPQIRGL